MGYEVSAYFSRGVLIDTGFPRVLGDLAAWFSAASPEGVIVTHAHEDHAGNVEWLAGRVPIQLAPDTAQMVRAPKPIGWYRRLCWGTATPLRTSPVPYMNSALELRPARGHSPDHHVVWDADRETIFGGDLFVGVKVRIAHPREDIRAQVRALRSVIALGPKRFFDAHRGPLEHPLDQLRAKVGWMEGTIGEIDRLAAAGWTDQAIRDAVLGREDLTGWASGGDFARINFVRGVLARVPQAADGASPTV